MRARTIVLLFLFLVAVAWLAADVKYTTEMQAGSGMPAFRSTVYVKGKAERRDMNMMGMETSTITDCTKRQTITINWKCKLYYIAPLDSDEPSPQPTPVASPAPRERPEPTRKGGVVVIENDIRDTGERQQMFGHIARHVLMKMKMESKEGACNPGRMEVENDLWVVDMALAQVECAPKPGEKPPQMPMARAGGGCRDTYQMNNRGNPAAAHGLPVKTTTTMVMANGQRQSMTTEIKDLSTTTLEASLFQLPPDFKLASSQQELYTCGMGIGQMMAQAMKGAQEAQRAEAQAQSAPAAGQSGEWLVGVVMTDKSKRLDATTLANDLVQKIDAIPGFDAVRIDSRAPPDIQKEAVEKKCTFLLYADVAAAKSSGPKIGGLLGRATGLGGSAEPRHDIRMDYRLTLVDPFDQQVAADILNHSEQTQAMEQAASNFMQKTAERATEDARRWKQQQRR